MNMRDYINLMETIEAGLDGSVDVRGLLKFLPEVTDGPKFMTAMNKIKQGQIKNVNRLEMTQLALAFVSLLGDANDDRIKAVRKLATLKPSEPDQTTPGM